LLSATNTQNFVKAWQKRPTGFFAPRLRQTANVNLPLAVCRFKKEKFLLKLRVKSLKPMIHKTAAF